MARKGSTKLPEHVVDEETAAGGDLLARLAFDHRQIERLWSELQVAHERRIDTEHRPGARFGGGQHELSRRLVTILAEHEAVELERLYPTVSRVVGEELAYHATADHEEIRQLLDRVDGEDPADEDVFRAFTKIMGKVTAHIDEEERIAFPMLRAVLSREELEDLGAAPPPGGVPADAQSGDVIDLAAAERAEAQVAPPPRKAGLTERGRRLLRRR